MNSVGRFLERFAFHLPYAHDWLAERDALRNEKHALQRELERRIDESRATAQKLLEIKRSLFTPIGHFYSLIPSIQEIEKDRARLFAPAQLPDIDFNEAISWNSSISSRPGIRRRSSPPVRLPAADTISRTRT